MARTIPKSIDDRLSFFLTHIEQWAADPGAVGLTPGEVAALHSALDAATAAAEAAREARSAAKSATLLQTARMADLVTMGAQLIARIKTTASGNPEVYAAAALTPPAAPTFTAIAPPTPSDFVARPLPDGSLRLTWTSDLKRTSFYRLERELAIGGRTVRTLLAAVRDNSYTDADLPIGYTQADYLLTPVHQRRGQPENAGSPRRATYIPGRIAPPALRSAAGAPPALAA